MSMHTLHLDLYPGQTTMEDRGQTSQQNSNSHDLGMAPYSDSWFVRKSQH